MASSVSATTRPETLGCGGVLRGLCLAALLVTATFAQGDDRTGDDGARLGDKLQRPSGTVLIGIGDSLTHGTLDATNNKVNTEHAYLQLVANALDEVVPLVFSQPFFNEKKHRMHPYQVPTNLAVDGSTIFTIDGIRYGKRNGEDENSIDSDYICDEWLPFNLKTTYEKVLFPINLKARTGVTAVDAAVWHLDELSDMPAPNDAIIIMWSGNNDSSAAALGGGEKPTSMPIPFELAEQEVTWGLRRLINFGVRRGEIGFEPFTMAMIERNLTTTTDFHAQYASVMSRLTEGTFLTSDRYDIFVLTLPYYGSVAFQVDSEDLEYYFQKIDPTYSVPPTFARVAPPGEPITDPLAGDRVSLLTFAFMYLLLDSGYSPDYVNRALEIDGVQRDGLVLSQVEQQYIQRRIDSYNDAIRSAANRYPNVHLVDAGGELNEGLAGDNVVIVGGKRLGRKWVRGSGFSLDGVHPSYTAHALIANYVIECLNAGLGLNAAPYDLEQILPTDPYVDFDGDGFPPGPDYTPHGMTEMLFLLTDPDDTDPTIVPVIPDDVWTKFSRVLLRDALGIPALQAEAERLGITVENAGK